MDYMEGGSLEKIVQRNYETFSDEFIKYTLWCTAQGIKDLHDRSVLHRDIKSDNILFNLDGVIKLADLGMSNFLTNTQKYRKTYTGTKHWIAPEILEGTIYSMEVDIWSFGCFVHELMTGKPPFYGR